MQMPELGTILFLAISGLIVLSSLVVVTSPNLVHSAVSLLFTLFSVAAIYVFLYADFIAATQVIIYVGGILVLIIFNVIFNTEWYRGTEIIKESTVKDIGSLLLTKYLLPFEIASVLLLAALIGAAMLSRKKVENKWII